MRYQVIISDRARQMLGNHLRFLAQVNRPAALKLKKRLLDSFRELADMPGKYSFFQSDYIPPSKYHKLYVENWYLVLYQIQDSTVYVDWIIDCRQDYEWLLH